jgi:Na+/H+ antiporter NhaC
MFDERDPEAGLAVGLAIAVAIFVALFTIAVALSIASGQRSTTAAAATPPLAPIKVYFGVGQAPMPAEAAARLARIFHRISG